ncbi:MAG: hypothetical protein ACRC1F_00510 [Metamycoplasmataceae bacterium]
MKKITKEHLSYISDPRIFLWLFIYWSPNKSVSLVTRLQKAYFLFMKEFIVEMSKIQTSLYDDFEGNNFGPYSKKLASAISELTIQNKINVEEREISNDDLNTINVDSKSFYDEDTFSDTIFTKSYKVFTIVDNEENEKTMTKIKSLFKKEEYDDFLPKFKNFCKIICNANINNILRYIYENFPQYTGKSIIKEEILNDKEGLGEGNELKK